MHGDSLKSVGCYGKTQLGEQKSRTNVIGALIDGEIDAVGLIDCCNFYGLG